MVMAGMSLVSSLPPPPGRKTTASTVSSSPPESHDDGGSLPSTFFAQGIVPDSPRFETSRPPLNVSSQTQPPGLSTTALPSPISKPGHSKDSSGSPSLTLTPNSSVDGNTDWISVGRQASPFQASEAPFPFLHAEGRQSQTNDDIAANFSALAVDDNETDGLLGLGALHERSISLSGPPFQSSSPPVSVRGFFSSQQSDFERPRSSRDRPPLSQSYNETLLMADRSIGGLSNPFTASSNSRNIGEANNISLENSAFGTIGRQELRQSAAEYDPNRRRSSSQDNLQNPFYQQQQQAMPDQFPNKFRTLPSLSSQAHQQPKRLSEGYGEIQKVRHVRSISQPGYPNSSVINQHISMGADTHYYSNHPHSYPDQSSFKPTRSASISTMPPPSYDGSHYDKTGTSMPNLNASYGGFQSYPSSSRRDIYEYQGSHGNATISDDVHSYNSVSPLGQSPHQMHFGSHIRQASESALLSPSVMVHGHGGSFGLHSGLEDDLADQLAGEHIDFPDIDDPQAQGVSDTFFLNQSPSHPLLRTATHAHSMSLDAIPSHYLEAIHRPTAGASLPIPKVVYAVKFKRSQRNFVLGPRISRDLKIGTYVKVEADRGEDLGIVVGKVAAEKYSFSSRTTFSAGLGPPPSLSAAAVDLKRIIRLATHDEVSLLSLKRDEEEELLKICRRKVRERLLPMNVVDAEYQFDRHKLTFFFEAEGRVDFRELVRDLFSMYKTRIWMQQLDKNTSTSAQAIVSPQAASLQMDFGTPIIAPPSEFADSIILNGLSGFDSRPI